MALFDGKVAIVTGGSSGIGQAACHLYAREGAMEEHEALEVGNPLRNGTWMPGQVQTRQIPLYNIWQTAGRTATRLTKARIGEK